MVIATAYCLKGHTSSGPTTLEVLETHGTGCVALSRRLAKDLGLRRNGKYNFGRTVELEGVGRFVFADLMPPRWTGYRVDIWHPTCRGARVFGIKRARIRVVD